MDRYSCRHKQAANWRNGDHVCIATLFPGQEPLSKDPKADHVPPDGTSLSRREEKLILALRQRKNRKKEGLFLAEGVRLVEELLLAKRPIRYAITSPELARGERGGVLYRTLQEKCPTYVLPPRELGRLAATVSPQGVLAVAETPRYDLEGIRIRQHATVLLLDGIQDPGNLGTMIRSADAFGADLAVVFPGSVDPWNPKTVRAAAGASVRLPVVEAQLPMVLDWLRRQQFVVYGTDAAGQPVRRQDLAGRVAFVMGNEGAGLSPEARAAVDGVLAVPIREGAESLNAAVAAGILLFMRFQSGTA